MLTIKKVQIQHQEDRHQYSATLKAQMIINEETTVTESQQDQAHVNELKTLRDVEHLESKITFSKIS